MEIAGIIIGGILVTLGVANIFFGLRLFRFFLSISGFIAGFALADIILAAMNASTLVILIGGVITGLLFAALAFFVWKIGLVISFGITGYGIFGLLLTILGIDSAILALTGGLAFAVVFVALIMFTKLWKQYIIIVTSIKGSMYVITGFITAFFGSLYTTSVLDVELQNISELASIILLLTFAGCSIFGIYFQNKTTKNTSIV